MPFFGFVVEPLRDAEGFFDGLCALLERKGIGGDQIFDFIEQNGIDRKKFMDMYQSFYVQVLCNKAVEMQSSYEIEGVPMIAIDGKYLTSPAIVSSGNNMDLSESEMHQQTLKVMDALVRQAKKGKTAQHK